MRSISGWSQSAIDTRPTREAWGRAASAIAQDAVGVEGANRQVVVPGPAEPAEVRAAAHHLDQQPRAELRVGREHHRRRRVGEGLRSQRPPSAREAARRSFDGVKASVRPSPSWVTSTSGGTYIPGRVARSSSRAPRDDAARMASISSGISTSPSPAHTTSTKGASGSGLRKLTAPPSTTRGCRSWRSSALAGRPASRSIVTRLV